MILRTTAEYNRRHRRTFRLAIVVSVLIHILIVVAFRSARPLPDSPFSAAGPKAGDDRAAAGGGMQVVAYELVREQPEPEQVEPIVPVELEPIPAPEIDIVVETPNPPAVLAAVDVAATTGASSGTRTGEGIDTATGAGDGGTAEEGRSRVVPPTPRGLILPPGDRPKQVRGREIDVWVFISATGTVIPDSTRVAPTTGDRRFDDRLKKQAAEWIFEPARRGDSPVAEWFRYTVIL